MTGSNTTKMKPWNIVTPDKRSSVSFQDIIKEQELKKLQQSRKLETSKQYPQTRANGYQRHHCPSSQSVPSGVQRYPVHRLRGSSQSSNYSRVQKPSKKHKTRQKVTQDTTTNTLDNNHSERYEYTQQMMHEDYLYSCSQMYSYFAPLGNSVSSNCIMMKDDLSMDERAKYVSLDCEMVGIGPGGYKSAVARVCIVNWDGVVILDTFVKVSEPVTDFRTFVSGVREEDLQSECAMEFVDCRLLVKNLLRDKILIGHALKNDLQALMIDHPWCDTRDTATYSPFCQIQRKASSAESDCSCSISSNESISSTVSIASIVQLSQLRLRPRRLKDLAEEMLGIQIQKEGGEHNPVEDALAALALYKLHRRNW
eukprot:CAMPEP_0172489498 /NCGR_PEP_ID=MMETSP1066-20121228/19530_1 /TAXON_ID=671091 /ORGANISM="Coscinodiscus wailesii, Strain CCMP2513" /LENGTH=367 /DNA_ID=CAMNT_0013257411 /DNA_START=84 /DNA_END=1184 /DNA_ORIENTATION=+